MEQTMRILAVIPGLLMLMNGFGFLTQPAQTAAALGMPYLDGIGRSTQVGDFTSFFIGTAVMCLLGAWQRNATWLYAGALLLGGAAVFRTVATVVHDAPFAAVFIGVEVVSAVVLLIAGRTFAQVKN